MSTGFDPLHKWLGIPPDEQPPHCYRLLGLDVFEDNPDVIESAADRQMAYLRTFQTGPNVQVAQEVLNQIAVAKMWLLNPQRKVQYDAWLREQLGPSSPPAPPVSAPPAPVEEAPPDLSEVLGGGDPFLQSRRRAKKRRQRQWMGAAISLVAAIVAIGVFGLVAVKVTETTSQEGTLEVQWPDDERTGGIVQFDGKQITVASGDALTFSLPTGRHRVRFIRPGYLPYELTVGITAGKSSPVRPIWRQAGANSEEGESKTAGKKGGPKAKKSGSADEETEEFTFDKKKNEKSDPAKDEPAKAKKSAADEKADTKPAAKASDPGPRLEAPDEADQRKARQTVRDVYKLDSAKTAADKQALAKRLLLEGLQMENDPVGQFVLLKTAEELAVEIGDGLTAFSAVEELSQRYQVDALDLKSRILDTFVKKARLPEQHKSVADQAIGLADAATAEGRLPLAVQFSKMAVREASKGRDKETIQRSRARAKEVEEIAAAYEEVKAAVATLAQEPGDARANLVAGKYHCFLRGDWDTGLPMLSQGSDANLKALARRDVEGTSVPEAQSALADEWRQLAGKSSGLARRQLQARAVYWYRKALPGLSGLAKAAAERWLKELEAPP